jgi:hypothetical protein
MNAREALFRQQSEFMAQLLDDTRALPAGWEPTRLEIYRNAYRARLVEALRETYPRTCRWVGDEPFARAAAHHLISRPPSSWTLDDAGVGFPETVRSLFARDSEVAELAWLEWAMHRCYVSADAPALDAPAFALRTAGFGDADWAAMHLAFLPGTQTAVLAHRIDRLWQELKETTDSVPATPMVRDGEGPLGCIVWRDGLAPVFATVPAVEAALLQRMLAGACYGELCATLTDELGEEAAVSEAGAMLGRWLHRGLIADVGV